MIRSLPGHHLVLLALRDARRFTSFLPPPWDPPARSPGSHSPFKLSTVFRSIAMFARYLNTRQVSTAGRAVVQRGSRDPLNTSRLQPEALFLARRFVVSSPLFLVKRRRCCFSSSCLDHPLGAARLRCRGRRLSLCPPPPPLCLTCVF